MTPSHPHPPTDAKRPRGLGETWFCFWHEFEVERPRWVALRFSLLGLFAVDLVFQMWPHAPRYGQGGLNATQFAWLDAWAPLPTPAVVTALWGLAAFAAARAALGVAVQRSIALAAVSYGAVYFWSQSDSFQHHYLLALLLGILAFLPDAATLQPRVRHFALRLVYVQMALLYAWAAVAKLDPGWTSGHVLEKLLQAGTAKEAVVWFEGAAGLQPGNGYAWLAWGTIAGETFGAAAYLFRPLRPLAFVLLPLFHAGVEVSGFEIEWFSFYMIAINLVLLAPVSLVAALSRLKLPRVPPGAHFKTPSILHFPTLAAALSATAAAAVGWVSPLDGALALAVLLAAATLAAPWWRPNFPAARAFVTHLAICLLAAGALRATEMPFDYHRLWAGDLYRRGELQESVSRYQTANSLKPTGPARYMQMGDALLALGESDQALAAYQESLRRHEIQLSQDQKATTLAPNRAEALFDRADTHARIAERCEKLARLLIKTGQREAAKSHTPCIQKHRAEAETAYQSGLELAPNNPRGQKGMSALRRRK